MRREIGGVAFNAVYLLDQLLFGRFTGGDAEQKTDHQPYLGAEKTVPLKNEDKVPFVAVGVGAVDQTDEMVQIVPAFFKEFEIVLSDETADRVGDRFTIQTRYESDEIVFKRVARPLFEDIAVDPFAGAVAGMKLIVYKFDALYPHRSGELDVEHFLQAVQIVPKGGEVDVDDLVGGVDAAVGSPRGFRGSGNL